MFFTLLSPLEVCFGQIWLYDSARLLCGFITNLNFISAHFYLLYLGPAPFFLLFA